MFSTLLKCDEGQPQRSRNPNVPIFKSSQNPEEETANSVSHDDSVHNWVLEYCFKTNDFLSAIINL